MVMTVLQRKVLSVWVKKQVDMCPKFNFKLSAQSLTKINLTKALAVIGGQTST
jgi:hypothetical protein